MTNDVVGKKCAFSKDYNLTVFLHVRQNESYEQRYDDKCLSPTELQRE